MAAALPATGDDGDRDLNIKIKASESENGDMTTKSNEAMADLAGASLASTKPTAEAHGGTKRKKATASAPSSEAGDDLHHDRRGPKRKEATSASEDDDDDDAAALKKKEEGGDSLFKEGEMLKLREEFWDAGLLWSERLVPGALDRWLKRKKTTTQLPAVASGDKKKKKVVRIIMPKAYIEDIIENPDVMEELSDEEEMAECLEEYRQSYAIAKLINAKNHAYQQALIAQYRAFGFAYDEKEVTDDDEKATHETAAA